MTSPSAVSQNGWPLAPALRDYPIPGTGKSLSLVADQRVGAILGWVAGQFNKSVQPLKIVGGYSVRPIGGLGGSTSNHYSGTAIDLNWDDFPHYAANMTGAQEAACRAIVAPLNGAVRWGGDYGAGDLDQMHFEINVPSTSPVLDAAYKTVSSGGAVLGGIIDATTALVDTASAALSSIALLAGLPTITTPPRIPLTPIAHKPVVSAGNRLAAIKLAGQRLPTNVAESVTQAQMDYSSTAVSQLTVVLQDNATCDLVASGLFARGSTVDSGDQHLEIRGLTIARGGSGPQITVVARSRAISDLRGPRHRGIGAWGTQDLSVWVMRMARSAGARAVVQPDLGTYLLTRTSTDSTWDVMQEWAKAVGVWCFEMEQIVVFAKPSWLVTRPGGRVWRIRWLSHLDHTDTLADQPQYTASYDGDEPDRLTLKLASGDAYLIRPGDQVIVGGRLGPMNGTWIVTAVPIPYTNNLPVTVQCERPTDPVPALDVVQTLQDQAASGLL